MKSVIASLLLFQACNHVWASTPYTEGYDYTTEPSTYGATPTDTTPDYGFPTYTPPSAVTFPAMCRCPCGPPMPRPWYYHPPPQWNDIGGGSDDNLRYRSPPFRPHYYNPVPYPGYHHYGPYAHPQPPSPQPFPENNNSTESEE